MESPSACAAPVEPTCTTSMPPSHHCPGTSCCARNRPWSWPCAAITLLQSSIPATASSISQTLSAIVRIHAVQCAEFSRCISDRTLVSTTLVNGICRQCGIFRLTYRSRGPSGLCTSAANQRLSRNPLQMHPKQMLACARRFLESPGDQLSSRCWLATSG